MPGALHVREPGPKSGLSWAEERAEVPAERAGLRDRESGFLCPVVLTPAAQVAVAVRASRRDWVGRYAIRA